MRVLQQVMAHEARIVCDVPINTKSGRIPDILVRGIHKLLQPARPVLNYAEEEHVAWRTRALPANLQVMRVPRLSPFLGVLVDGLKEKVMKKPDVSGNGRYQAVVNFKLSEEQLPLVAEAVGDIVPQTLDARIVDAP